MSAKADKGDWKREIEQSPMKKKFRDLYSDQEKGIWSGFEEDDSAWSPALPHISGGN